MREQVVGHPRGQELGCPREPRHLGESWTPEGVRAGTPKGVGSQDTRGGSQDTQGGSQDTQGGRNQDTQGGKSQDTRGGKSQDTREGRSQDNQGGGSW